MAGKSSKKEKSRYCDYKKHKYFNPQVPRCKRCDKCPVGMGLVPFDDEPIRIDKNHGAMVCQRCVRCVFGKNFNKYVSYKPCIPCKDCEALGKMERKSCTPSSNTKCQRLKSTQSQMTINTTERNHREAIKHATVKEVSLGNISIAIAVVVIFLMLALPYALYCYCQRKSRNRLKVKKKNVLDGSLQLKNQTEPVQRPLLSPGEPLGERVLWTPAKLLVIEEDYCALGIRLGVSNCDIAIIREDCRGNSARKSFEVLNKWRKKLGQEATRGKLYDKLREINRLDVIDAMEKERHLHKDERDLAECSV
ncbi:uncharacterized protein LOC117330005 [Pecten maximus]|uniref:uncharacterized protein LOC117330005 n=1 Tax=Pecten maximus TaxID=6579 RepID=UPI001458B253|nr:uncharacterized protein LOC117330005 [Pecten maximus]